MTGLQITFGIILVLFALAIIVIVLLQEGHQQSLGAITGGADTFFSKNKTRSMDSFLARWTKVIAIGFFVVVITVNAIIFFTNSTKIKSKTEKNIISATTSSVESAANHTKSPNL